MGARGTNRGLLLNARLLWRVASLVRELEAYLLSAKGKGEGINVFNKNSATCLTTFNDD